MHKLLVFATLLLLCIGCQDDQSSAGDCEYIHAMGLSVEPMSDAIMVNYGFFNPADAPIDPTPSRELSCEPEEVIISISSDGQNFETVATLTDISGSFLIEDLEDCKFVTVKVEGNHTDLRSVSATRVAIVGEIASPQFTDHSLPMDDFTMARDNDRFIYRTTSDKCYLSSFSNPSQGQQVFNKTFRTRWNPNESNKVAGVENILVPILTNTNGIASKYLVEHDLDTGSKDTLHEITDHMDFKNDVYRPELYWIHEFHYSQDGQSIYFMSNKDNGGSTTTDQKVYDNIWRLDLTTRAIEALTDFLPLNFDLIDFVEDPKKPGNFYLSGGERDVQMGSGDSVYFVDREDIHYYDSADNSITPIFVSNEETQYLSIDPTGENLVFTTTTSGRPELRNLNTSTQKQKQLTYSTEYRALNKWSHINWLSSTEVVTNVLQDGDSKFAKFNIE